MLNSLIQEIQDLLKRVETYEKDLTNLTNENALLKNTQFKSGDIELTYTRLNGKVENIKIDRNESLTKNFKVSEFLCPNTKQIILDELLITIVQNIRDKYNKPITITSGYRTQAYNDSLPGSDKNSLHIKGKALDIMVSGVNKNTILAYVKTIPNVKYAYTNETNMLNAVHFNI
jgi:uncharacterized protein YcbK (DUF882 family)